MYLCKVCGNRKLFKEHNCTQTEVTLDESSGEVQWMEDKFLGCSEVICSKCNSSSEDGAILDRNTMKPIVMI